MGNIMQNCYGYLQKFYNMYIIVYSIFNPKRDILLKCLGLYMKNKNNQIYNIVEILGRDSSPYALGRSQHLLIMD